MSNTVLRKICGFLGILFMMVGAIVGVFLSISLAQATGGIGLIGIVVFPIISGILGYYLGLSAIVAVPSYLLLTAVIPYSKYSVNNITGIIVIGVSVYCILKWKMNPFKPFGEQNMGLFINSRDSSNGDDLVEEELNGHMVGNTIVIDAPIETNQRSVPVGRRNSSVSKRPAGLEDIGKTCPYCQTQIIQNDDIYICPACNVPHHKDCWHDNEGCTSYGCVYSKVR